MRPANEEIESNEPTPGFVATAELEYSEMEVDYDEALRPAGEAGLFGDPRPVDRDDEDGEPELVRS